MRQMKITQMKTEPLVSFILFKPDPKIGLFSCKKNGGIIPQNISPK
jgi:hypothetical protein